ncbi:Formamidopyrimidine-DNA glycosylase [Nymphon striatum]|nr:Formamidopyrimidine-DNA glycosylase [Nymphon striatum]
MSTTALILATALNRYYGNYHAVKDVHLSIHKGEVLGLLGPNGAGKSSTMQMLTGNLSPSSGEILINGVNLINEPETAKRSIGYLPEQPPVYRDMTPREYLTFCASLHDVAKVKRKSVVNETMERCGLEGVPDKLIGNLSKGYQQRVGIAQAILHKPDVVILDEPTVEQIKAEDVFKIAVENNWALTELTPKTETLEQIFMNLVHTDSDAEEKPELEIINPDLNPARAKQDGIDYSGQLLVKLGERSEKVNSVDEQTMLDVLQRLSRTEQRLVVFIEGHDERSPLSNKSTGMSDLSKKDFLEGEVTIIADYLKKGGNLLWLHEPGGLMGLDNIEQQLGLEINEGTLLDANPSIATNVMLSLTDDADKPGPLDIAVALKRDVERDQASAETGENESNKIKEQRVLVIGDSDFMLNSYIGQGSNLELASNIFNWLSVDDDLLSIKAKVATGTKLDLSTAGRIGDGTTGGAGSLPTNNNFYSHWVHSYEEQNGQKTPNIFRPKGSREFPASRFRMEFGFDPSGQCNYKFLSPVDAHEMRDCVYTKIGNKVYIYDLAGTLLKHISFTLQSPASKDKMVMSYGVAAPIKASTSKDKANGVEDVVLENKDGLWKVTKPVEFDADKEKVRHLFTLLSENADTSYSIADKNLSDFGLDKEKLSVSFNGVKLLFGDYNEVAQKRYVLKGDRMYLISETVSGLLESGKAVRLHDPRRFGAVLWTNKNPLKHKLIRSLGPEPLSDDFNAEYLFEVSRGRSMSIKQFIMNGHVVVGVGNIYACESLFMSGISPKWQAGKVSKVRYQRLVEQIKIVLANAIEQGGTTLKDFVQVEGKPGYFKQELNAYGRAGEACNVCGAWY